ncbi:mannose-6-phosphate isomerase-like protein (cupin superfamily) [Metabacillus crassostreae]|uniref:cupin domain-containing protein n=1 Tax=Metabacillus crassostreae TaxID=929098 RepID=UPI00195AE2FD|nr:cupin domain-containing protein [Metabacillus crassostreae]MBM7602938.1 mannose-6-phosphate isomerase-like protein (cupin superfamily) [Metabacillus crassostreae]
MYYVPNVYQSPKYALNHKQIYNSTFSIRNSISDDQDLLQPIILGIKKEASAIQLYNQLVKEAYNEKHKNEIHYVLSRKRAHLTAFTNYYTTITGMQPEYTIDKITYRSYQEGLQKAFKAELDIYENFQKNCYRTQDSYYQHLFIWALSGQQENTARIGLLNEDLSNQLTDYGAKPFVVNIEKATKQNDNFRTVLWTGKHLQLTLMSINVGEDIGLEIHPTLDQFLRVEQGQGIVQMGDRKNRLDFQKKVYEDYAIIIPAGKWHNLINTGNKPLKLYSIYAPPQHPYGTIHETKAIAMAAEEGHHN